MMTTKSSTKQIVSDRFVEKFLTDLFGKPKVPAPVDLFLRNRGFDIQKKFETFDFLIQEFMSEDGKIKSEEIRKFVEEYLPSEDFYLQDKWEELRAKISNFTGGKNGK